MVDQNRRRFQRIRIDSKVRVRLGSELVSAELLDISLKGALLTLEQKGCHTQGSRMRLSWSLAEQGPELIIDGTLHWTNGQRLGMEFERMDLETAQALRRLLELNLGTEALIQREIEQLLNA